MEYFEISEYEARQKMKLFLRLRMNKSITEKTVKDFEKLLLKLHPNFKDHDEISISKYREDSYEMQQLALDAIRCQFMNWEGGGNCRLSDIDNFSLYKDEKYRATIKGEQREISERDFGVLQYIVFGRR